MTTKLYEDNAGGLTLHFEGEHDREAFVVTGLEHGEEGRAFVDMHDADRNGVTDWTILEGLSAVHMASTDDGEDHNPDYTNLVSEFEGRTPIAEIKTTNRTCSFLVDESKIGVAGKRYLGFPQN